MDSISIIILSNTLDDDIYQMNSHCISSLFDSENWDVFGGLDVILIESNKTNKYAYDERVRVLLPQEEFNFNRFLNIGVQSSFSQYIALCNNDIVFSPKWFTEILKVKSSRPDIHCFSPIDRDYETMSFDKFPEDKDYYIGWDNKYHFAAWCFVLDRKVFSIIGIFDEKFNFYGADDDFLMTLRKYSLDNALVVKSQVKHLSQQVTNKIDKLKSPKLKNKEKYPIPEKYLKRGFEWLRDDFRYYDSFIKMDEKWGDLKMIGRINRLLDKYPFFRKRCITELLYSKQGNTILSKLTGIK